MPAGTGSLVESGARTAKNVLRPARNRAVHLLYGRSTRYTLRLQGRRTLFSTEEPAAHRWFYPRYAFNRVHEKSVTLRLVEDLKTARSFADVGANLGYYSCLAAHFMGAGGQAHAFEMDRDNFRLLEGNVALNPSDVRVELTNAAVSDAPGTVTYRRPPDFNHPALSLYNPWPMEGEVDVVVPALTLDAYFEGRSLPDLMKVDVEGAELHVLRGASTVLPSVKRLYLEVHPQNLSLAGQSTREVFDVLTPLFDLYWVTGHREHRAGDLVPLDPAGPVRGNTMVLGIRKA